MKREVYDVTDYGSDDELHNLPIAEDGEIVLGPVRLMATRQVAYVTCRPEEVDFAIGDRFRTQWADFVLTGRGEDDGWIAECTYHHSGEIRRRNETVPLAELVLLTDPIDTQPMRRMRDGALLAEYQIFQHDTYHEEGGMGMAAPDRAAASVLYTEAVRRLVDERAEKKRRSEMLPVDWGDDE